MREALQEYNEAGRISALRGLYTTAGTVGFALGNLAGEMLYTDAPMTSTALSTLGMLIGFAAVEYYRPQIELPPLSMNNTIRCLAQSLTLGTMASSFVQKIAGNATSTGQGRSW